MALALPTPITAYVEANARLDVAGMLAPFAVDAVVHDNGSARRGRDEIRSLLEEEVVPVKAIFTPDAVRHEEGQVVVEGPAHGDFPGSPGRSVMRFVLDGPLVGELRIEALR